jgi:hypothetical protein
MIGAKITIIEDTVTEYLHKLDNHFHKSQPRLLKKLAEGLTHEYITPLVPTWNPNLYLSGLDESKWIIKTASEIIGIEVIYTGFTKFSEHMYVWWEFGGFSDMRYTDLQRDYAYYQETGKDEKAKPFEGHHYVKQGTKAFEKPMQNITAQYMDKIMRLQNINGTKQVSLDSF